MKRFTLALLVLMLSSLALAGRFDGSYELFGTVNNKYGISMDFTVQGSNVYGSYGYDTEDGRLSLNGTIDAQGYVVLYETDNRGNRTGVFRGHISPDQNFFSGTWSTPDGKTNYPFAAEVPGC